MSSCDNLTYCEVDWFGNLPVICVCIQGACGYRLGICVLLIHSEFMNQSTLFSTNFVDWYQCYASYAKGNKYCLWSPLTLVADLAVLGPSAFSYGKYAHGIGSGVHHGDYPCPSCLSMGLCE